MDLPPEPHRGGEVFAVAPLTGSGKRRGALLAASCVVVGMIAVVGIGVVGRITSPSQVAPSPRPATAASASEAPGPSGSGSGTPAGADTSQVSVTTLRQAGYSVAYPIDATHQPIVFNDGALAVFGYGERTGAGTYDGTIYVSVGTPARPAAVLSHAGLAEVFGSTLPELEESYLLTGPGKIVGRETAEIDGGPLLAVEIEGGPAGVRVAALIVHGGRAFIVTAAGFEHTFPGTPTQAARTGLRHFLAGFEFGTSLFVSRELGFQVPLPTKWKPFGTALNKPLDQAIGLYVFPDGEAVGDERYENSIGVSVGSKANPALVRVLPSALPNPLPRRIWAASLVELQAAYLAAIPGKIGSTSTVQLGGELALVIEHPDGLAKAVLAIHHGRVYMVSTTGLYGPDEAPDFDAFIAGFTFID